MSSTDAGEYEYVYETLVGLGDDCKSSEHRDKVTAAVNGIAQYGWRLVSGPTRDWVRGGWIYSMVFERPRKPVEE